MEKSSLEENLKKGIVVFKYKKSDGTIRSAIGTLLPHLIPSKAAQKAEDLKKTLSDIVELNGQKIALKEINEWNSKYDGVIEVATKLLDSLEPKPSTRPASPDLLNYFDLGSGEWRSFKMENLVNVIATY